MHERGVQKQIGHQLIIMEMAGHEEMQSPDVCQVDAAHLEDKRGKESNQVDDQQILCDGRYAEHHCYLRFINLRHYGFSLAARFRLQNYKKYLVFALKMGGILFFFIKKAIFSFFLLFL